MSDQIIADIQRRLANIIRRGIIHSVRHEKIPVCRVKLGKNITGWLPICQAFTGANRSDSNSSAVGDVVTIICEGGDLNNGRVIAGWPTGKLPVPDGGDDEHITVYGDGTEIKYNRTQHNLKITLAGNGTYEIIGDGKLNGNVEITQKLVVQQETNINANVTVNGNIRATEEISDGYGRMSNIRTIYNGHTHTETDSVTLKPNQPM